MFVNSHLCGALHACAQVRASYLFLIRLCHLRFSAHATSFSLSTIFPLWTRTHEHTHTHTVVRNQRGRMTTQMQIGTRVVTHQMKSAAFNNQHGITTSCVHDVTRRVDVKFDDYDHLGAKSIKVENLMVVCHVLTYARACICVTFVFLSEFAVY